MSLTGQNNIINLAAWTAYLNNPDGDDYSIHGGDKTAVNNGTIGANGYFMLRRSYWETTDVATTITIVIDRIAPPNGVVVGAASVRLNVADHANSKASRVSIGSPTVNWADGVFGPKEVTVTLAPSGSIAYTGAEYYHLFLDTPVGGTIHGWDVTYPSSGIEQRWVEYNARLKIKTSTINPNAIYASPDATNYAALGTVGDPKPLLQAAYELVTGDFLYLVYGTDGLYQETGTPFSRGIGSESTTHGTILCDVSGTDTDAIVITPYPGASITVDAGYNVGAAQPGGWQGVFCGRGTTNLIIDGDDTMTLTQGTLSGVQFGDTATRNSAINLSITDINGGSGTNPAGIRLANSAYENIFGNITITNVTEAFAVQKTGGHRNNACIITFDAYGNSFENITASESNSGYYNKFVPSADHAHDIVRGCIFHDLAYTIFFSGVSGGTPPRSLYALMYENLDYTIDSASVGANLFETTLSDSGHYWAWNNTFSAEFELLGVQQPLLWNNLFTGATSIKTRAETNLTNYPDDPTLFNNNTKIGLLNWNGYVDTTTLMSRIPNGSAAVGNITSLAALKALDGTEIDFHSSIGAGEVEFNGITDTLLNCFTNAAGNDYTIKTGFSNAEGAGYNGVNMGCYADIYSTVGVQ